MSQSFNNDNVKKLVKNYIAVLKTLNDSVYLKSKGNDKKLTKLYGVSGFELLNKLENYVSEMKMVYRKGKPSVHDVIMNELSKFTVEEYESLSLSDMFKDPRIKWDKITKSFEGRYSSFNDAEKLTILLGDVYKEEAGMVPANLHRVSFEGKSNDASSKVKKLAGTNIATGVLAAGLATALIVSGANQKGKIVEVPVESADAKYIQNEADELEKYRELFEKLGVDGFTDSKINELENKRNEFAKTDKDGKFSSTPSIEMILELANLQKDSSSLVSESDYLNFFNDTIGIIKLLNEKLDDKSLSKSEKQQITNQINNLISISNSTLKDSAKKFGEEVSSVIGTIADINAEIDDLNKEVSDLNQEISSKQIKETELNAKISALKSQVTSLNNTISQLNSLLASSSGNSDLAKALVEAQTKLADAQREIANLNIEKAILEGEKKSITDQYNKLNTDYQALNKLYQDAINSGDSEKIAKLEQDKKNLEAEIANLKKDVETLKVDKQTALDNYNKLYSDYQALLVSGSGSAQQIAELNAQKQKLESELASAKKTIEDKDKEIANLQAQISNSDSAFISALYTKLTGDASGKKTTAQMKQELIDIFDIGGQDPNSNAKRDEGQQPQR